MLEFISQNPYFFYTIILLSSIASVAGVGGFWLIPMAALYFGPKASVGIITLYFLFNNISKLIFFKGDINWKIAKKIIVWSLPGVLAGSLLLGYLPANIFEKILGIGMLIFLANDLHSFITKKQNKKSLPVFGLLYGFFSGLFGSGNIIKGPLFISLGLTKESYVATYALTSLFMNIPKLFIYSFNGVISPSIFTISLPFLVISIFSAYIGKLLLKKIDGTVFYYVIFAVSIISAIALLF